jgi:transposase
MDINIDSHVVRRMEIVETGRRRRWTDEAKLRIVAESYSGPRQASATARRHGISNQLLHLWRRAWREGRLGEGPVGGFVPAVIVPEACAVIGRSAPGDAGRMEVVSANGRRVIVDQAVDVAVLVRIVQGLESLR